MTLAIPYVGQNPTELRYCLRSLNHLASDLIIIGPQPSGFKNYTHIPFTDNRQQQWAHRNVWEKLCLVEAPEFIWSADDVYATGAPVLNYSPGLLRDEIARRNPGNPYTQTLRNTLNVVGDAPAFNIHCPMAINRERLHGIQVNWSAPHGYCIKTLYGQGLEPVICIDQKLYHKQQPGPGWFSSSPSWMAAGGERILKRMFPVPSKWEK